MTDIYKNYLGEPEATSILYQEFIILETMLYFSNILHFVTRVDLMLRGND